MVATNDVNGGMLVFYVGFLGLSNVWSCLIMYNFGSMLIAVHLVCITFQV